MKTFGPRPAVSAQRHNKGDALEPRCVLRCNRRVRWAWLGLLVVACTAAPTGAASPSPRPTSRPVPSTFLAATSFLGARTAWVSVYSYKSRDSRLFKTDDAGHTWEQVLSVKGATHPLQALDGREVVVQIMTDPGPPLQTSIYRTLDGGAHWTSAPAPSNPFPAPPPVMFLDVRQGWFLQMPRNLTGPRVLFHTVDGGKSWDDMAHLDMGYDITFRDSSTGWLARGPQGGSPALMMTRDGGLSWTTQPLTAPVNAVAGDARTTAPHFLDARQGKLTVHILSTAQPLRELERYAYSSHDGGETWTVAGRLPVAKVGNDDYGTQTSFQDGLRGWAGSGTSLFKTSDGGATWTNVATSLPRRAFYFAELSVFSDRVAWGQISDFSKREGHQPIFVLVRTADGGAHWTAIEVPGLDG